MKCRGGCGACCIALSISTPLPGMPEGKPAGIRCAQLTDDLRCAIFGRPERPACCAGLKPSEEMCGETRDQALHYLNWLEQVTRPASTPTVRPTSQSPAARTADHPVHSVPLQAGSSADYAPISPAEAPP